MSAQYLEITESSEVGIGATKAEVLMERDEAIDMERDIRRRRSMVFFKVFSCAKVLGYIVEILRKKSKRPTF